MGSNEAKQPHEEYNNPHSLSFLFLQLFMAGKSHFLTELFPQQSLTLKGNYLQGFPSLEIVFL
jgi:hypothetical protein